MDQFIETDQARICLREYGSPSAPPLLMIHGLSMQLTDWPARLISSLAVQFRVIVFDNRDCGKSSKFGPCTDATEPGEYEAVWEKPAVSAPYNLLDMMEDTRQILNRLDIDRSHILGYSMGGMIAQMLAIHHPDRINGWVSLMSSDGSQFMDSLPQGRDAMTRSMHPHPDPDKAARSLARDSACYAGPNNRHDPQQALKSARASVRRSYCPTGILRQAQAITATPDRKAALSQITNPPLILHGTHDPCIQLSQAQNLARLIPDASLVQLDGIGHEICDHVVSLIVPKLHTHFNDTEAVRNSQITQQSQHRSVGDFHQNPDIDLVRYNSLSDPEDEWCP